MTRMQKRRPSMAIYIITFLISIDIMLIVAAGPCLRWVSIAGAIQVSPQLRLFRMPYIIIIKLLG